MEENISLDQEHAKNKQLPVYEKPKLVKLVLDDTKSPPDASGFDPALTDGGS